MYRPCWAAFVALMCRKGVPSAKALDLYMQVIAPNPPLFKGGIYAVLLSCTSASEVRVALSLITSLPIAEDIPLTGGVMQRPGSKPRRACYCNTMH